MTSEQVAAKVDSGLFPFGRCSCVAGPVPVDMRGSRWVVATCIDCSRPVALGQVQWFTAEQARRKGWVVTVPRLN